MSALQAFINQKNQWNAIFEIKTAAGRQRVASMIDSDLSPENLTCDGEMPRSQVQARYRILTAAAKELVKLDPSVKIYELS